MSGNTYRLKVDLKLKHTQIVPTFVQYDNARIDFQLFDNGKVFDLTDFTIVEVAHRQSNGTVIIGVGEIVLNEKEQQIVRYDYLGSEMANVGLILTSFSLFNAEGGNKVSIHPFEVRIVKDNRDGATDYANPEFGLLQTYQAQLVDLKADMNAKIVEANTAIANANTEAVNTLQVGLDTTTVKNNTEAVRLATEQVRINTLEEKNLTEAERLATKNVKDATQIVKDATATVRADTLIVKNDTLQVKTDTLLAKTATEAATTNANTKAIYATTQGDYAKSVADSNKNTLLPPVANFAAIATTYPSPVFGSKVQTTDNGKIYRFDGTWKYVEEMNSNMLTDIQNKLNVYIEVKDTEPTSDTGFWLDTSTP